MEVVKTGNSTSKGEKSTASMNANFQRDTQRVSVRNIITDHFRKTK